MDMINRYRDSTEYQRWKNATAIKKEVKPEHSTSWIAVRAKETANKVAKILSGKANKPIVVMKDVNLLTPKDRAQLFDSMGNISIVFQSLDGAVKVVRANLAERIVALT